MTPACTKTNAVKLTIYTAGGKKALLLIASFEESATSLPCLLSLKVKYQYYVSFLVNCPINSLSSF